jgi:hypothetical protein
MRRRGGAGSNGTISTHVHAQYHIEGLGALLERRLNQLINAIKMW